MSCQGRVARCVRAGSWPEGRAVPLRVVDHTLGDRGDFEQLGSTSTALRVSLSVLLAAQLHARGTGNTALFAQCARVCDHLHFAASTCRKFGSGGRAGPKSKSNTSCPIAGVHRRGASPGSVAPHCAHTRTTVGTPAHPHSVPPGLPACCPTLCTPGPPPATKWPPRTAMQRRITSATQAARACRCCCRGGELGSGPCGARSPRCDQRKRAIHVAFIISPPSCGSA
jgi:hypothetical protein